MTTTFGTPVIPVASRQRMLTPVSTSSGGSVLRPEFSSGGQKQSAAGSDMGSGMSSIQSALQNKKLADALRGGGTTATTGASMPPTGILTPSAYSSSMNAGPAMNMAGVNMQGLTAGLPGMGGASPATVTPGGGSFLSTAGPWAAAAAAGDRAFYGNGALGNDNLERTHLVGKLRGDDLGRLVNPSSYIKEPEEVAKSALHLFTLGIL